MAVRYDDWRDPAMLAENREQLLAKLTGKLRGYEARYELSSSRLEEELNAGRLRDTAEVADWVITFHAYQRLVNGENGRQA